MINAFDYCSQFFNGTMFPFYPVGRLRLQRRIETDIERQGTLLARLDTDHDHVVSLRSEDGALVFYTFIYI